MTALRECTTPPSEPVEWEVEWVGWGHFPISGHSQGFINEKRTARTAFEAHRQVPQAPAFGSCRVRRVESEPSFHDYSVDEDAFEREQVEAEIAKAHAT